MPFAILWSAAPAAQSTPAFEAALHQPRSLSGLGCGDAWRDRLILVGSDALWEWNGATWLRRADAPPEARAVGFDEVRGELVVYLRNPMGPCPRATPRSSTARRSGTRSS